MPRLEYFVVSESSAIDQVSGRVSLFHILEHLRPQRFPAFIPKCVATVTLVFEDDEIGRDYQVVFSLSRPGVEEIDEVSVNFTPGARSHRILQRSMGMPIKAQGCLRFGVKVVDTTIEAHHEIKVHGADPGQATDGTLVYSPNPTDVAPSKGS